MKRLRLLVQDEGTVMSQDPSIGLQENMLIRGPEIPQQRTKAPMRLVVMRKSRPGKIDRYRYSIEILARTRMIVYVISQANVI